MEFLERLPFPRRLAARVWLLTVPSALLSFERRQRLPKMPIGRGRLLGLLLVAGGVAAVALGPRMEPGPAEGAPGLVRLRRRPAVGGALLALTGVGLLMRSLLLTAYALGLAFAFARESVDLEEPQLPGRGARGEPWEYDETQV